MTDVKKILLPLAVVAISGGYVWAQKPWLADEPVTGAIAAQADDDTEAPVPAAPPVAIVPAASIETAIATPTPAPAPVLAAPALQPQPVAPGYVEMLPVEPTAVPAPAETSVAEAAVPNPAAFADGKFTGSVADAYYGPLQVAVQIEAGRISDVQVLQYPDHRRTSRRINSRALPALISEAISAQSSEVDFVTGATLTSEAFAQSLAAALKHAAA